MRKLTIFLMLACMHIAARGQTFPEDIDLSGIPAATNAAFVRYWFDDDESTLTQTGDFVGQQTLDVSSLLDGLHTVHYQIVDEAGELTTPCSQVFMKYVGVNGAYTASRLRYWFDDDTTSMQEVAAANGVATLDVNALLDGLHTIHYQLFDANGMPSYIASALFFKIGNSTNEGEVTAVRMLYWFDDDAENIEEVALESGMQILDVSSLLEGIHTLHFQIVDGNGQLGCPTSSLFMKWDNVTETTVAKKLCYWFDDDISTLKESDVANGAQTLDASELLFGIHTIHCQLTDETGTIYPPNSALFMKMENIAMPDGKNTISQYMYWLNSNSKQNIKVDVPNPTSSYSLTALLPMDEAPIRSTNFHFEVADGVPTMYAKNDIHFRFFDACGYWSDDVRSFIDYHVKQEVAPTALLATQTFVRPSENEVKWFSLEAQEGDTIAFKTSQATTIQVFAPSGKEVYSASADKSVIWGGCHTWEDGTFYVAVHDVTGTKPNVTLDYMHMDKYYVHTYTPTIHGNMNSQFEMHIVGNGLDMLKNVLVSNGVHQLVADTIYQQEKSNATALFTIQNADNGKYDICFTFEDKGEEQNLNVENGFELEDVRYEDLSVTVGHQYSAYNPVTLRISVTNPSNVAYSYIPLNIAWDRIDNISKIDYNNFWVALPLEADSLNYSNVIATNNLLDKGVKGGIMFLFIPRLGPSETMELMLDISFVKSGVASNVYAWAGIPLELDTFEQIAKAQSMSRTKMTSYDPQLARNILGAGTMSQRLTGAPRVPRNANIAGRVSNTSLKTGVAFAGISEALDHENDMQRIKQYGIDLDSELGQQIAGLHGNGLLSPGAIWGGPIGNLIDNLMGIHYDCSNQPLPEPTGHGGAAHQIAVDPNDIYGYKSMSGSHYMPIDVQTVPYTIEFENDAELASASAHSVVIKDTLDSNYFDLSTFAPTCIKIGNKSETLDGTKDFVKTIDMRPSINVIVQVECSYDQLKGIATWEFTSLDPMTMEPTDDVMQGFLPVNYDGVSGMGEVAFDISLKQGLADGTEIPNRASIVFDSNEPILTPTWTNIIDAVAPTSVVSDLIVRNDSIYDLRFEGEDNRSGIWKYTLYVQDGLSAPWREVATDIAPDSTFSFKGFDCINYGFCVLATDSAGNVERKELTAEVVKMSMRLGDVNADGDINVIDFTAIANHIMGSTPASFVVEAADVNEDGDINVMDLTGVANLILFGEVSPNRAQANSRMRRVSDQLTLHVSDCEVMAGEEFTVDIHMDGDADFSAFQFDMALPEGIHVKMVDGAPCATLSTERTNTADTDFFVSRLSDDGTLRVFCASTRNVGFEGNEGCVAHVTLIADEKALAGDYEVAVSHIVAAYGGTGENLSPANFVTTVGGSTDMNSLIDGTHGSSLYDLVGKKIRKDHERTGLEKGAYINNGKKVIVK